MTQKNKIIVHFSSVSGKSPPILEAGRIKRYYPGHRCEPPGWRAAWLSFLRWRHYVPGGRRLDRQSTKQSRANV